MIFFKKSTVVGMDAGFEFGSCHSKTRAKSSYSSSATTNQKFTVAGGSAALRGSVYKNK